MSTSRLWLALALACALWLAAPLSMGPGAARAVSARATSLRLSGPALRLTCRACLVVDDTGRRLLARRAHLRRAQASTTKMLTALLVARRAGPGEIVEVSIHAAGTGGGGLDLQAGESYRVEDLLYALLLDSSNDASVALAEHVSGSEATFVDAMNRTASALGAVESHFLNPHGLDRRGHYSTAADLALLAEALLGSPRLAPIVRTSEYSIEGPEGPLLLENRNALLETYRGANGVKTGFTDRAGEVLVATADRGGRRLIVVAMGSRDAAADSRRLLDLGFARLRRTVVVRARISVGWLVFDPGGATPARIDATVRGMWHPGSIRVSFFPDNDARPPVHPGDAVGELVVAAAGKRVAAVPALASSPIDGDAGSGWVEALGAVLSAGHGAAAVLGLS